MLWSSIPNRQGKHLDSNTHWSPNRTLSPTRVNAPTSVSQGEPETPLHRPAAGPAHRRHIRTIQEVRTTVTRTITDVYYEDGREVDRKVTEVWAYQICSLSL